MKTNLTCDGLLLLPHYLPRVLGHSPSLAFISQEHDRHAHRGRKVSGEEAAMSSECSSGCQSGWTTYFLPSSAFCYRDGESFRGVEEEEEEGLSMISDASSGPPHFNEDDGNGCFLYSALVPADGGSNKKKKKRTSVEQQRNQHSSALDDTASSQLFNNSVNSFTDCNYRTKKSMEETFFQSQEQVLQAQSALKVRMQMGYSQCSACVKQNPTRPGSRKKGRKMI